MLFQRKISTEIIGGGSITNENTPFTPKIEFFIGRVKKTDLTEVIARQEGFLSRDKLIWSDSAELGIRKSIDSSDGIRVGFVLQNSWKLI